MPKSITFDRDKIMDVVVELFWKKGYNGTSMQDLVDATGLNRSSFYNTFVDKFTLFEASLTHYQQKQNQLIPTVNTFKSPKQAITSLFKGISKDIMNGDQKGCLLTNCTTELVKQEPRIKSFLQDNKNKIVNSFISLIQAAQENGEIDPEKDSQTLALYLFSSLQGLRVTSMIDTQLEGVTEEILRSI
ncbi:MAG: TetR/AcrR family transcriptional regulator [Bacteroidota bacterium]